MLAGVLTMNSTFLERRVNEPEMMDSTNVTEFELKRGLDFLRITNRYFGGNRVILRHLKQYSRRWTHDRPVTILDVGCGLADIPVSVVQWARRTGVQIRVTAVDFIPKIVSLARENTLMVPEITVEKKDIFSASETEVYDYVTASLFLHHIPDHLLGALLKKFDRLASCGIIISDLHRTPGAYWATKMISNLIGNSMVQHDGPLSVRRSFTLPELQHLALENGLYYLRARKERFFRLSLTGEKG